MKHKLNSLSVVDRCMINAQKEGQRRHNGIGKVDLSKDFPLEGVRIVTVRV